MRISCKLKELIISTFIGTMVAFFTVVLMFLTTMPNKVWRINTIFFVSVSITISFYFYMLRAKKIDKINTIALFLIMLLISLVILVGLYELNNFVFKLWGVRLPDNFVIKKPF